MLPNPDAARVVDRIAIAPGTDPMLVSLNPLMP
jgi:hypothetical protein